VFEKLADSKFDLTNAHNIKSENLAARCSKEVKQNNTSQILNVNKICSSVTEAKQEAILFFTSELGNQSAKKALFTCVVLTLQIVKLIYINCDVTSQCSLSIRVTAN